MTSLAVDWVHLSTPEFVGWTRRAGVRLPFPLNTQEQEYIDTPDARTLERLLAERHLDESAVLAATARAFADPRLVAYVVRSTPAGVESKYVGVTAREGGVAVLVLHDPERVAIRAVADTELAAGVVGAMPRIVRSAFPPFETATETLTAIDQVFASGASTRTIRVELNNAGFPPAFAALRERMGSQTPSAFGLVAATGRDSDDVPARNSTRPAAWVETAGEAVLQCERPPRGGRSIVRVSPMSTDSLFQAVAESIASVYEDGF